MTRKMLGIAAARFSGPSITFIRDHVSYIAPGNTVLLSRVDEDPALGCEHLSGISPVQRRSPFERAVRKISPIARSERGPTMLSETDVKKAVAFLMQHSVTALFVEYLTESVPFIEVAKAAEIPLFAHAHGSDATNVPQNSQLWRDNYIELFDFASGIFCPSQYIANRLLELGCDQQKITITPCGVKTTEFQSSNMVNGNLLAVGRLVHKKAPHRTIEAFSKISERHPNSILHIVGDGPLRKECTALISRLGLKHRIVMHGAQPRRIVLNMLRDANVFVQHSVVAPNGDSEGLPVAILEAMASNVPVVSTRHSGIPEAVVDGETGYLVDEHDVDAMANHISRLLSDRPLSKAFGAAGKLRVESLFDTNVIGARIREKIGLADN